MMNITGDRHTMRNRASEIRQCYILLTTMGSVTYPPLTTMPIVVPVVVPILVNGGYVTLAYL